VRVRILDLAEVDLQEGFDFYERQESGVGVYFLNSVFSDIDSLVLYARIHPMKFGFHRMLCERFPYAVYYSVDGMTVSVWRVLDLRRDPHWIVKQFE
jgi:plasmid stabilization system protein ParE